MGHNEDVVYIRGVCHIPHRIREKLSEQHLHGWTESLQIISRTSVVEKSRMRESWSVIDNLDVIQLRITWASLRLVENRS